MIGTAPPSPTSEAATSPIRADADVPLGTWPGSHSMSSPYPKPRPRNCAASRAANQRLRGASRATNRERFAINEINRTAVTAASTGRRSSRARSTTAIALAATTAMSQAERLPLRSPAATRSRSRPDTATMACAAVRVGCGSRGLNADSTRQCRGHSASSSDSAPVTVAIVAMALAADGSDRVERRTGCRSVGDVIVGRTALT